MRLAWDIKTMHQRPGGSLFDAPVHIAERRDRTLVEHDGIEAIGGIMLVSTGEGDP